MSFCYGLQIRKIYTKKPRPLSYKRRVDWDPGPPLLASRIYFPIPYSTLTWTPPTT